MSDLVPKAALDAVRARAFYETPFAIDIETALAVAAPHIAAEALRQAGRTLFVASRDAWKPEEMGERLGADWAASRLFEMAGDIRRGDELEENN